jgi:sec-independent protein translocase protein TatA
MGSLGAPEIILIIIAILILFGGKKIPELMKGLGKGMKEFKDAQNGEGNSTNTTSGSTTNTSEDKPRV